MNRTRNKVPLNIELTDIITPKSCSLYVAELIKYVLYNKEQIPYPYEHLKKFVLNRRERLKMKELTNDDKNFQAPGRTVLSMEKYYKKVEEAFETLNSTFKCIEEKLLECHVEEIVLLFGATPVSPKDVYRIQIPSLFYGHSESQHSWRKQIANLFREIIISDDINTNLRHKINLTNMFVMIKVSKTGYLECENFLPKENFYLSDRSNEVCFFFTSRVKKPCSCILQNGEQHIEDDLTQSLSQLSVVSENIACINQNPSVQQIEGHFNWLQVTESFKGFKDSKFEGKSIVDLWYTHHFL